MLLRDIIRIYTLLQKNNEKTNPTLSHIVLKSPKMSHLSFSLLAKTRQNDYLNEYLSTQNVNVARFARNVE